MVTNSKYYILTIYTTWIKYFWLGGQISRACATQNTFSI